MCYAGRKAADKTRLQFKHDPMQRLCMQCVMQIKLANAHALHGLMEQQVRGPVSESDTQSVNHSFDRWLPVASGKLSAT